MRIDIIFGRKIKTDGTGMIEFRLMERRQAHYISTGIKIRKTEWRLGRVVNRQDADALNDRLAILYDRLNAEINNRMKAGLPIDAAELRPVLWSSRATRSTNMYDWLAAQVQSLPLQPGTLAHYATLLVRLREYGQLLQWHDLTVENIYQFDAWLRSTLKNKKGHPIGDGAVHNYHKWLKALLSRAVRFGIIEANPYDRLRAAFPRGEKATVEYLTEPEMQAIERLNPTPGSSLAHARDLFIFQMFTGMAYADTQAFNIADYAYVDGHWQRTAERIKTGVPYVSRLLPPAVEVLQRNSFRLPQLSNQKYNVALKNLGDAAGIRKRLTSHMARHTFATWALHHGVPIEIVSRMLGHTDIAMTQRYAKVLAEDVNAQFTALESVINTDNGNH